MNRKILLIIGIAVGMAALNAQGGPFDRMFGFSGRNGGDGITGARGASYGAQSITIAPGAASVAYNFGGGYGGDGGNGGYASAATNCFTRYDLDEDLQGAPGGDGGDAGAGGNGGDGANVTVTYTPAASGPALEDLRKVQLYLAGGAPGRSGAPGIGQPGCRCQWRHWTVIRRVPVTRRVCQTPPAPQPGPSPLPSPLPPPQPVCHDVVDYVDQNVDHYCTDGRDGRDGSTPQGSYGRTGSVTLIPTTKPTDPDFPTATFAVGQMPFATTLTQDNWATGSGGPSLFAPGSVVADSYRFYAGRTIAPVRVVWNAKRSTSDLSSIVFGAAVNNGTTYTTHSPSQLWAAVSKRQGASGAVFSIDAAAKPSEAMQVSATLSGSGTDTVLILKDAAGLSDIVKTSGYVKLESKGLFWHTRWDATIPQNQIEVMSPTQILIHIGRFYPSGDLGDLKPGKKFRVTLTITRSLGEDSGNEPEVKIEQNLAKQ